MKNVKFTSLTCIFFHNLLSKASNAQTSALLEIFKVPHYLQADSHYYRNIWWYLFLKNISVIFSRHVDVKSHSANTEAHQAGTWTWHFSMQDGDWSRKPDTELRLWRVENKVYNRGVLQKVKELEREIWWASERRADKRNLVRNKRPDGKLGSKGGFETQGQLFHHSNRRVRDS